MPPASITFMFDVMLGLGALMFLGRLTYVRSTRRAYLEKRKYKPGMVEYANIFKVTSIGVLCGVATVAIFFVTRVVLDVQAILHSADSSNRNLLIAVPVAAIMIYALSFYVTAQIFKKSHHEKKH